MSRTVSSFLLLGVLLMTASSTSAESIRAYVGTYTNGDSEGIYTLLLDTETGQLSEPMLAAEVKNPSFVAISPDGRYLYSVSEVFDFQDARANSVTAFSIGTDEGKLTKLNLQPSGGAGACHVSTDPEGRVVLVANYGGGSVSSIPVSADGRLQEPASFIQHTGSSVNPQRQDAPHAHSANVDATGKFAVVADLGLDQLLIYQLNPQTGELTPNDPPFTKTKPGGGPRHFTFHPNEQFAYSNLEITSEVTAFRWDADAGTLEALQTISSLPADADGEGNSTAEILTHPSGKFVYCSNRGHNSIAVYAVDQQSGELTHVENESTQGKVPRGFGIDPTGQFLVAGNQQSGTVVSLRIDQSTGALSPTGSSVTIGNPVNVRFVSPQKN